MIKQEKMVFLRALGYKHHRDSELGYFWTHPADDYLVFTDTVDFSELHWQEKIKARVRELWYPGAIQVTYYNDGTCGLELLVPIGDNVIPTFGGLTEGECWIASLLWIIGRKETG